MRATKSTPRDPVRVLERRHALAEIVERGAVGLRLAKQRAVRPSQHCLGDGPPELCQDKLLCVGVAPNERRWLSCSDVEPSRSRTALLLDAGAVADHPQTQAMYFVGSRAMNETVVEAPMPARGSTIVQATYGRYALTHLEGNVMRFGPLYQQYNGGAQMKTHWMKNRNATIFEPPHRKRRGRVSRNSRDELQRRRAKKARLAAGGERGRS